MAEMTEQEAGAVLQEALADIGSDLVVPGVEEPGQELAHGVLALDESPAVVEDDAPAPPTLTPLEERLAALEARMAAVASRDDLAPLQATQQQIADLVAAIAQQRQAGQQGDTAPTQAAAPVTLEQAMEAYVQLGDKSLLQAYEAQQRAQEHAQQAAIQQQGRQQAFVLAMVKEYPFLEKGEGWNAMAETYAKLVESPSVRAAMAHDPQALMRMPDGRQVDARLLVMASEAVRSRFATAEEAAARAQQAAQDAQRQQQSPTVAATTRQVPARVPALLLPDDMVRGEDALLNDPRVRDALEKAGLGADPRTQAKNVAESLSPQLKARLRTVYRAGGRGAAGAA